jgi:hypothetical protein
MGSRRDYRLGALQVRSHGSLHETRVSALIECDGANADSNFCVNVQRLVDLDQKERKQPIYPGTALTAVVSNASIAAFRRTRKTFES